MPNNVRYKRNGVSVSVEQIDGLGKNPGLWIGTDDPNKRAKVASFGSKEKAEMFIKWMDYLLNCEGKVSWE